MTSYHAIANWIQWPLNILRWLALLFGIYYFAGGLFWTMITLNTLGFSALFTAPIGRIWFAAFGRTSFDLTAVFFERKITVVLFEQPLFGEQIWWWWLRPSIELAPMTWLAIALGCGGLLGGISFLSTNIKKSPVNNF